MFWDHSLGIFTTSGDEVKRGERSGMMFLSGLQLFFHQRHIFHVGRLGEHVHRLDSTGDITEP